MLSAQQFYDTHEINANQGPLQNILFGQITELVDALAGRAGRQSGTTMLDDTVVLVVSEMGRTPQLNGILTACGVDPRDHLPDAEVFRAFV